MIRRSLVLTYGAVAYLAFLVTFGYTIGFLAGAVVPKGVDDGSAGPAGQAVLIDLALLTLFALQHSVMARPAFKRWWTTVVPPSLERSTYVLAATGAVALLLWQWRPLPEPVWSVETGWARGALWTGYVLGWALVVWSTFLLGHFDLFGLRQSFARAREKAYRQPEFAQPWLYRLIRHPIMTGFLIAFWVVPQMSTGRLLFAAAATGYILVGVRLEEHDLRTELGAPYREYERRVPRFAPSLKPGRARAGAGADPAEVTGHARAGS